MKRSRTSERVGYGCGRAKDQKICICYERPCDRLPENSRGLVGRDLSSRWIIGKRCTHLSYTPVPVAMIVNKNLPVGPSFSLVQHICKKRDALDRSLPLSASLLLGNSATLQETLQYHNVTNALLGPDSIVPYAISGAVYSGTLSLTVLELKGVYESYSFASIFETTPSLEASDLRPVYIHLEGNCKHNPG
jgi:hypothetical protein